MSTDIKRQIEELNRRLPAEAADDLHRDPRILGAPGSGRDHDAIGLHGADLLVRISFTRNDAFTRRRRTS